MSKFWRPLLLSLLVLGCASVSYQEPQGGERARVRFAIGPSVEGVGTVRGYQDEDCNGEREWMRLVNGFYIRAEPRRLQMPLWDFHDNGAKEFYVAANEPLFFMFQSELSTFGTATTIYTCAVPITFQPEADADYELILHMHSRTTCEVEFSEIVSDGDDAARERLGIFKNFANEGCIAAFHRFRWF